MTQKPLVSQRTRHTVEPRPHPGGSLLHVKNANGQLIYRIIRKPICPTCYSLQPMSPAKLTLLTIKSKNLDTTRWYTLYKNENEQLSLRYFPFIGELQLRDHQQNTLAKFIPLSPMYVQIRTSTEVIARLRHTQYAHPLRFRIVYDGLADDSWFFAFLLYSVALVEETIISHPVTETGNGDAEKTMAPLNPNQETNHKFLNPQNEQLAK